MIRRPPRSTPLYSSAASDVYKRQNAIRLQHVLPVQPSTQCNGKEPHQRTPECEWTCITRRRSRNWWIRPNLTDVDCLRRHCYHDGGLDHRANESGPQGGHAPSKSRRSISRRNLAQGDLKPCRRVLSGVPKSNLRDGWTDKFSHPSHCNRYVRRNPCSEVGLRSSNTSYLV